MKHLAVVMDGNRRWARSRFLDPWLGHKQGVEAAHQVIAYCLEHEIPYLSLYTFSLENFKRSAQEQSYIFGPLADSIEKSIPDFDKKGIRVSFVGDRSQFPHRLAEKITKAEQQTVSNDKLFLQILFCYGGRQEIVSAVTQIAQAVADGVIDKSQINEQLITSFLWMPSMIPDPDMVVRTGGMKRLSNFLPYQTVYSEICFVDTLWPDFTVSELDALVRAFAQTRRTFGA